MRWWPGKRATVFKEVEKRARLLQPPRKWLLARTRLVEFCVLQVKRDEWGLSVRLICQLRPVLIVNPHDCFLLQYCLFLLSELRCVASTTVWNQGREHDEVDGFIQNRCNDPLSTVMFSCDHTYSPSPRTLAPRSKTQPWQRWPPRPTPPKQSCWLPTRQTPSNRWRAVCRRLVKRQARPCAWSTPTKRATARLVTT